MTTTEPEKIDRDPTEPVETGISNYLTILDRMVERNVDPAALKGMMDLAERHERNQAIKEYNTAFVAAVRAMPTVVKDAENKGAHGAKYALRETIQRAIKPVYTEHGFALSFSTEDCPLPEHVRIVCEIVHEGGDIRTKRFDIPLDGKGSGGKASAMNAPQATGSTYSYGCRYATLLLFNVTVAGEDDDAQGRKLALTSGQIQAINILIEQVRQYEASATAAGKVIPTPFKAEKFYAFFQVKGLDELCNGDFDKCVDMLARKAEGLRKLVEGQS